MFFLVSGFCSVLYELVWLRLSMAQFGVTTAMVSIVLSVFMAGIGLGSWASGRWLDRRGDRLPFSALRLYALVEFLIGVGGIVVPYELGWGRRILEGFDLPSSLSYYSASGLWVACTLAPWCALMGATIPIGMRAIGQMLPGEARRSFSYLYMANVAGAVVGTAVPLILIELLGFHGTLRVGAFCNGLIAVTASGFAQRTTKEPAVSRSQPLEKSAEVTSNRITLLVLLFLTGLTSMGMEVVWVRQFTPYLGTVVYAFASILGVYLAASFLGSRIYRKWSSLGRVESPVLWTLLGLCALFPLVTANPNIVLSKVMRITLGVAPFTGLLGFLTPMLVDRQSGGDPGKAGSAYAVNVLGCILGPLLAGFVLLPSVSERWSLILLSLPWLVFGLGAVRPGRGMTLAARGAAYALLPLAALLIFVGKGYDEKYPQRQVLRDPTATVIATGNGMDKKLLINGYGVTSLNPITKMMAHFPLAYLDHPPKDALDICFGMGTTFRSLLSWRINTTAVELVPSVPRLFGYYHSDGDELLKSPLAHVVIDDGRRYLERSPQQYDVITIDPPPPLEAAGSSMLYSEEFYAAARKRLRHGGVLAQWLPGGDPEDVASITAALRKSFPYVRGWENLWGLHFLASEQPLPDLTAEELQHRMPPGAASDLVEWAPAPGGSAGVLLAFHNLLQNEVSVEALTAQSAATPSLTDDRPINEYYLLRRRMREHGRPLAYPGVR